MLCRNRKLIFLSLWNQGSSAQHCSVCRSLFYIWFFKKSCDSSILHSFRNPWGEVSFRVAKNLTTMIFRLTNSKLPKLISLECKLIATWEFYKENLLPIFKCFNFCGNLISFQILKASDNNNKRLQLIQRKVEKSISDNYH